MALINFLNTRNNSVELVFISNNKRDFTDGGSELAQELVLELNELTIGNQYFQNIGQYLDYEARNDKHIKAVISDLDNSLSNKAISYIESKDYYFDLMDELLEEHTDINDDRLSGNTFSSVSVINIGVYNVRKSKDVDSSSELILGAIEIGISVVCSYVSDIDYDGPRYEEIALTFYGELSFKVPVDFELEEVEYEDVVFQDLKVKSVHYRDPIDDSFIAIDILD